MNPASEQPGVNTSMNGHVGDDENASRSGDNVDVNVETSEIVGIVILGFMFFMVLLALLRSQRRERKLLERIAKLQAELNSAAK